MTAIAQWIERHRPAAVVVDVFVEVALFTRLLGVPVIVMAVPGDRTDAPHRLVHQLADHIIASWPSELYEPSWLKPHADKTTYVGGITRFAHRSLLPNGGRIQTVLVLGGAGGCAIDQSTVDATALACPGFDWLTRGLAGGPATADLWPDLCTADIVVTVASQGCIADTAAARRPAVVIPQSRPFGEQHATAAVLHHHHLATVVEHWPAPQAWPGLLTAVARSDADRWMRWHTCGAAERAAQAIVATARRSAVQDAS